MGVSEEGSMTQLPNKVGKPDSSNGSYSRSEILPERRLSLTTLIAEDFSSGMDLNAALIKAW